MARTAPVPLGCLLAVIFVASVSAGPEELNKFFSELKECHQDFPDVTNDTVKYAVVHDLHLPDESQEDARCLLECVMKKQGFLQPDGSFDVDKAMENSIRILNKHMKDTDKSLDMPKVKQLLEKCSSQGGGGKCEKSYNIIKCTFSEIGPMTKH